MEMEKETRFPLSTLKSLLFCTVLVSSFAVRTANATNAGTDLNLDHHIVAAGMAGAAHTMPQEASAAIFGNPATLTWFRQGEMNIGASFLPIKEMKNVQTTDIQTLNAQFTNDSISAAENYIVPTVGFVLAKSDVWTWAAGLEVDAGIGTDYRDDPITLLGGAGEALGLGSVVSLPLITELISINANVAVAVDVNEQLSLGASVTTGLGFAQLGTSGNTEGLSALNAAAGGLGLSDFGGTSSSVHDIGFAFSLGAVWKADDNWAVSAAWKSELGYEFENIVSSNSVGFQTLSLEQPSEWITGVAYDKGDTLIEIDVIYKQWEKAATYKDVYKDQTLINLGLQLSDVMGSQVDWRVGYSYASKILRDVPNNGLDNLTGVGSIPLGDTANSVGLGGLAGDVVKVVQMSLVPVLWEHTVTTGVSYPLTSTLTLDVYLAYAFSEVETRRLDTVDALLAGLGLQTQTTNTAELDSDVLVGLGVRASF